jgi:hypothetical protein
VDTERLIFTRGGARSHLFIYLLSFFISGCLQGQAIGYFSGVFDYDYKNVNRIVNQDKHYNTDTYQGVIIDYPFNENISIGVSWAMYWGWTSFRAEDELRSIGDGSAYTKLNRYGVQGNWNIFHYKNIFKFSPYVRLDYEKTDVQISGLTNSVNYLPDPKNNYEGSIFIETFDGGQVLPSLGLRLSLRPFWKVWIFGDLFYSFGHKTHQRLYFDYSYKGVPQQRAEWHSQGSGFVKTIGIGIQLWDENKRKKKQK